MLDSSAARMNVSSRSLSSFMPDTSPSAPHCDIVGTASRRRLESHIIEQEGVECKSRGAHAAHLSVNRARKSGHSYGDCGTAPSVCRLIFIRASVPSLQGS